MADGMQSPQLGGTQIDDAFTFDAMSPVQIENGSPLSANLGNNNNNNNGKQHSPIRDGVDDNHTKLITYNWENFVIPFNEIDLNNLTEDHGVENLMSKAKIFFKKNGLLLNWREFERLDKMQKINTLSMISPVTNEEKQKLLEALTIKDKIEVLDNIISFYLHDVSFNNQTIQ